MKVTKTLIALASVALAALLVLVIMGAIYRSAWTLDGQDVTSRLNDRSFVEENFSNFRELHTIDLNGLVFTVTGRPTSALPAVAWESSVGDSSFVIILMYLSLFAVTLALLWFSLNKSATWLLGRRGAA